MKYKRGLLLLIGLLVVVGLPLGGKWSRRHQPPHCEFDGLNIEPRYRARVVDRAGGSHAFCCIRCAGRWLARQEENAAAVYVTDERHGTEIDATAAWFARSTVVTNPITGNRVHAFREQADAEAHIREFRGRVLSGAERPLQIGTKSTAEQPGLSP
jgi:nitrous oxide reductase accessory protein NosL